MDIRIRGAVGGPELTVSHLPCGIDHAGTAKVESYFIVEDETGPAAKRPKLVAENCKKMVKSAFRGRELKGAVLEVPSDYIGVILSETKEKDDGLVSDIAPDGSEKIWRPNGVFKEFTHFNHDDQPIASDVLPSCMDFLALARTLHLPKDYKPAPPALSEDAPTIAKTATTTTTTTTTATTTTGKAAASGEDVSESITATAAAADTDKKGKGDSESGESEKSDADKEKEAALRRSPRKRKRADSATN